MLSGSKLFVVSHPREKEVCVKEINNKLACDCKTGNQLKICCHIVAFLHTKTNYDEYCRHFKKPKKTNLISSSQGGRKPNEANRRKGGRIDSKRPYQVHTGLAIGGYSVIRNSNRISICHGCKRSVKGETHVIRHTCKIPFPFKNIITGEVTTRTPSTASNHYFHLNLECIKKSAHHKDFNNSVDIDAACYSNAVKHLCLDKGFIVI